MKISGLTRSVGINRKPLKRPISNTFVIDPQAPKILYYRGNRYLWWPKITLLSPVKPLLLSPLSVTIALPYCLNLSPATLTPPWSVISLTKSDWSGTRQPSGANVFLSLGQLMKLHSRFPLKHTSYKVYHKSLPLLLHCVPTQAPVFKLSIHFYFLLVG
jgi:hypothetical protein